MLIQNISVSLKFRADSANSKATILPPGGYSKNILDLMAKTAAFSTLLKLEDGLILVST